MAKPSYLAAAEKLWNNNQLFKGMIQAPAIEHSYDVRVWKYLFAAAMNGEI